MNSVDFLLTNKDITYEIRTDIKRLGRPIPDLIISKTDVGNYSRNFSSSVYDRFKWLCGCPKRNKLFCFICLVMGSNQSAWTQEGECYKYLSLEPLGDCAQQLGTSYPMKTNHVVRCYSDNANVATPTPTPAPTKSL
ncbi:hypothetical protein NQ318_021676 [Aromia moschata]|uniref:Uncharacterized protein n=1 Tax=Aromia moschata TaxID=1265417 RepID=A0AAV8YDF5_9CUCU|nr:hypothetical protein NQ318_021676 [Aromia moschata]